MALEKMVETSNLQNNPIIEVKNFIDRQNEYKQTQNLDKWRL